MQKVSDSENIESMMLSQDSHVAVWLGVCRAIGCGGEGAGSGQRQGALGPGGPRRQDEGLGHPSRLSTFGPHVLGPARWALCPGHLSLC